MILPALEWTCRLSPIVMEAMLARMVDIRLNYSPGDDHGAVFHLWGTSRETGTIWDVVRTVRPWHTSQDMGWFHCTVDEMVREILVAVQDAEGPLQIPQGRDDWTELLDRAILFEMRERFSGMALSQRQEPTPPYTIIIELQGTSRMSGVTWRSRYMSGWSHATSENEFRLQLDTMARNLLGAVSQQEGETTVRDVSYPAPSRIRQQWLPEPYSDDRYSQTQPSYAAPTHTTVTDENAHIFPSFDLGDRVVTWTNTSASDWFTTAREGYWTDGSYAYAGNANPRWTGLSSVGPSRVLTAEELDALSRSAFAREEERRKAEERALELLLECMAPAQQETWRERPDVLQVRSQHGKDYYINGYGAYNVKRRLDDGHRLEEYCLEVLDGVPKYDKMLAQKLLLECDEDRFLAVANRRTISGSGERGPSYWMGDVVEHVHTPLGERLARSWRERLERVFINCS